MAELSKSPIRVLVPAELVERSAFLDKGSGVKDSETLTLCEKISAWFYDGKLRERWVFNQNGLL